MCVLYKAAKDIRTLEVEKEVEVDAYRHTWGMGVSDLS